MREILFRAQRSDTKEWIEGFYVHDTEWAKHYIYKQKITGIYYQCIATKIIPETVGQFTGLKDKNGKMIFEGDKFQVMKNIIYEVRFCNGAESNFEWYGGTFILWKDEDTFFPFDANAINHGEIIGNIHDNPELLNS